MREQGEIWMKREWEYGAAPLVIVTPKWLGKSEKEQMRLFIRENDRSKGNDRERP